MSKIKALRAVAQEASLLANAFEISASGEELAKSIKSRLEKKETVKVHEFAQLQDLSDSKEEAWDKVLQYQYDNQELLSQGRQFLEESIFPDSIPTE